VSIFESSKITGRHFSIIGDLQSLQELLDEYIDLKLREQAREKFLEQLPQGSVKKHAETLWNLLADYASITNKRVYCGRKENKKPEESGGGGGKGRRRKRQPRRVTLASTSSSSKRTKIDEVPTIDDQFDAEDPILRLINTDLPEKLAKAANEQSLLSGIFTEQSESSSRLPTCIQTT